MLPSLVANSPDAAAVVTALLGYTRPAPTHSSNILILDHILEDILHNIESTIPIRTHIQEGSSAVNSILAALEPPPPKPPSTQLLPHHLNPPPPRRPPRKKRYHDATPSTHCHVCCRPSSAVPMAVCSNIKLGTCRKVVCKKCITSNDWNWEQATSDTFTWICPHCTDSCSRVSRAQCWVYMRTNLRRKMNGIRKRARITPTASTTEPSHVSNPAGIKGIINDEEVDVSSSQPFQHNNAVHNSISAFGEPSAQNESPN